MVLYFVEVFLEIHSFTFLLHLLIGGYNILVFFILADCKAVLMYNTNNYED